MNPEYDALKARYVRKFRRKSDDEMDTDYVPEERSSPAKRRAAAPPAKPKGEPPQKRRRVSADERALMEAQKDLTATAARPKRRSIKPLENQRDQLGIIGDPVYELFPAASGRGGSYSEALLGPFAVLNAGSDARSHQSLPALTDVRRKYPTTSFYAGHLLNSNFGGRGADNDGTNLTVLTGNANHTMTAFDNQVERALRKLQEAYELLNQAGENVEDVKCGIRLRITVSQETWGPTPPDDLVATSVECTAEVERGRLDEVLARWQAEAERKRNAREKEEEEEEKEKEEEEEEETEEEEEKAARELEKCMRSVAELVKLANTKGKIQNVP